MSDPFGYPTSAANPPTTGFRGCEECNPYLPREHPKLWPTFTIDYQGTEVCAKCLTPIHAERQKASS